jgi:hypothetical protein
MRLAERGPSRSMRTSHILLPHFGHVGRASMASDTAGDN